MMLVMEVVTTALLLVIACSVTAQKPTTIADASVTANEQVKEDGVLLGELKGLTSEVPLLKVLANAKDENFGKNLESEEYSEEHDDIDDENDDAIEDDEDDNDSEVSSEEEEEEEEEGDEGETSERYKRKVIFRGGGGGTGIYSRGGRRGGGGGGEEDPYGRRRDHYGPDYGPYDSWPYRRSDIPYDDDESSETSTTAGSTTRSESAPVYGTTRMAPDPGTSSRPSSGSSSSSIISSSSTSTSSSTNYGMSNASGRDDTSSRRTKTERRETAPKTKISKELKWEIAQYAMQNGAQRAAEHFEDRVGRKLRVKKIEKFVKRYESKM